MTQYRLDIEEELWDDFKGTMPKNRTINEVVTEMIETRVESN